MNKKILYGLTALIIALPQTHGRDDQAVQKEIVTAKTVISEYVNTRQQIARTKAEWEVYRELADRRISLYEREIRQLRGQIERAEAQTTQAEREIARIRGEIAEFRSANDIVARALPELEDQLREIAEYFPAPLTEKVGRLVRQLGRSRQATERMAVLLGILNEVDKFNSEFTMVPAEKRLDTGETRLVDVVYVGLTIGYYADRDGTIGGILRPARGGWEWEEDNSRAPAIRRALQFYSGEVKPAELVELPLEIKTISFGN